LEDSDEDAADRVDENIAHDRVVETNVDRFVKEAKVEKQDGRLGQVDGEFVEDLKNVEQLDNVSHGRRSLLRG